MDFFTEVERIRELSKYLFYEDINKGKKYYDDYIGKLSREEKGNYYVYKSYIESERTINKYLCQVIYDPTYKVLRSYNCTCPQFRATDSCKHLGAMLFHYYDDIFKVIIDDNYRTVLTKNLFQMFDKKDDKKEIKEQVNLEVEVTANNRHSYNAYINIELKVGLKKLYLLKGSKLKNFLDAYVNEKTIVLGKSFEYIPSKHYFSQSDKEILDYLVGVIFENETRFSNSFMNNQLYGDYNIKRFLNILKDKEYKLNYYNILEYKSELPLNTKLEFKDKKYRLKLNKNNKIYYITGNKELVQIENTLYTLNKQNIKFLDTIENQEMDELVFDEKDKDNFKKLILPMVKNNIEISEDIKDIKITKTMKSKLYFDLYQNFIICNLKFLYDDEEVDYFDTSSDVLRDKEKEDKVVDDLLSYNFVVDDKTISLNDIDDIGRFIEEDLEKLTEKYDVYTSEKIKKLDIIKKTNVTSTFSIGQDNILSYSFDLGEIKETEIVNILESLKNKKKYYRLKSGDIIDLNDKNLQELEELTNDLNLSKSDIKNGTGEIPKYRAIYLDSLKKDKFNIIKTNNLFDELVNNFNKYKDANIKLSKKDKELLRDYQIDGVKWLYNIDKTGFGGILADEMGLGKSIQTIYYIKELLKENKDYKFLIVAPTSLAYNWDSEFKKFGNELKYKVFVGNKKDRIKLFEELDKYNIIITTYGLLREDYDYYKEMMFKTMIIDEAQNIKNVHAGISKTVKSIKANTKIALTGTPIENSLLELWSIFDYIMPGFLSSLETFDHKYKIKELDEDADIKLNNLQKLVSPFIMRRRKKDVMTELPEKIENNIYVDLTKEQKKIYLAELEKVKEEMDFVIASEGISKARFMILQLLTKLRQICIDPKIIYSEYKGGSGKLDEFVKVVKETILNGHKILIFTSFKTALEISRKLLQKEGITSYQIDGSVSSKKRMEMVEKFNNDDTNVFFIMLKAGGTGLNLTGADVVIHLDLWWNPQVENQATDRAHRIGQKNIVQVIRFISVGTIEEKILELQKKKRLLSDKLLDSNQEQNMFSKLTEKDIKELLSYDNKDEE